MARCYKKIKATDQQLSNWMAAENTPAIKNYPAILMSVSVLPIEESQCRLLAIRNILENTARSEDCANKDFSKLLRQPSKAFLALERKLQARVRNKFACALDEHQPTSKMLVKMFNWLSTVCWSYDVDTEGIFLCVELVNSYLELRTITKAKLQALGVVCLLLSCKYTGQEKSFKIQELCSMCKNIYSEEELLELEARVLETIDFDLEQPHTFRFLKEYIGEGSVLTEEQFSRACFWLEVQLLLHENHEKYSKRDILSSVLEFVLDRQERSMHNICPIMSTLLKLLKTTPFKTVCHRYESKFDTEGYLKRLGVDYT